MGLKASKSSSSTNSYYPIIQRSNFVLELVQNADENVYPCDVEATLTFIFQETGVIVLNNDQGLSAESMKALCDDVCNIKKKEPSGDRYIDNKGIGFKSVFRVSDAPEIHSNEFNIKFNISDGSATAVPPRDVSLFCKMAASDCDPEDVKRWNTCMVLPKKNEALAVKDIIFIFRKLHPHVMLFLQRLKCIKYINFVHGSYFFMRKEVVGDGMVNISSHNEKATWFIKKFRLQADHVRQDVQTTDISMALMLKDSNNGNYTPHLCPQLVFAFLRPIGYYNFNFIIQADFIVSSSMEEVDADSPWNKWLLSEFPNVFVSAELSFCSLPCFRKNPARGVSVFLSFVPLGEDFWGFFSSLPQMIISKLRVSNCLLLEGGCNEWVRPCKVVRNWTEQIRSLLPDSLLREHGDVGYLNKDVVLSDSLAQALGIEECGPKFLVQIMISLCGADSLRSLGVSWLSSWLNVLFMMLVDEAEYDVVSVLRHLPFIPLLDGNYASISDGEIWLLTAEPGFEMFGNLYPSPKLRIVDPDLFSDHPENVTEMLYKFGVQRLSAHEVLKLHILPSICAEKVLTESTELMIEYLSFILYHLESSCSKCRVEKQHIFSQLSNNAYISTNYGGQRPVDVPIHFSEEFGNPVDMNKLVGGTNMKWCEIDIGYLKHPVCKSTPNGTLKWREFLQKLGVTDFVQVVEVEKRADGVKYTSPELMHLLSHVTTHGDREKSKYLLKVLSKLWDGHLSNKPYKSYVIRMLHDYSWMASSMDDRLHFPKDLFHRCKVVHMLLGHRAPYTVPNVRSVKFSNDIGLKKTVTLDDALSIIEVWRGSKKPHSASVSQMSNFYTYLCNRMSTSKRKIVKKLHSQAFIFVPHSFSSTHEVVSGSLLSPSEVYWHDSFGSIEQTKSIQSLFNKMLCNVYPGLHNFFVNEFGVAENPTLLSYLQSLLQLSTESLPSQAAKTFFHVLIKWSEGLDSWVLSSEDIDYMKMSLEKRNMKILPTVQNKWVSLHQSFGLVCWCDDEQLRKEFMNLKNVHFLSFGQLSTEEKQMLRDKVSVLLRSLGIPSLSEVVTREAVYSGTMDNSFIAYFINGALPYAQRYIYSFHRKEYSEFKNLKIVVVEKLFYKNVIKKFGIESKKQFKCSCLLQDNILYATPDSDSDSHSIFMELSRFLVAGVPELPLANFLHQVLTTEPGYIEEQTELFSINKQKLLKLPSEESEWSMFSISSTEEGKLSPTTSSGLSPEVPSPAKSTPKKLQRRSKYASKKKEANSDQRRHDEASVNRKEDEDMKDQSGSGTYKGTVSSDMNDGFTSNEREIVDLNSEKHGKRCVKKVKEGKDNSNEEESAKKIIECIRREEFGLGSDISATEKYSILKEQHNRLGEALHCLSQELYSQDSHFLLELVRNADENMYPCDVEPTLTFILQETGVIVLNNDQGFSVETIKALCKVGNSSKTEPSTGYISKKGIGFKSVFRVTDAPEIHSNGFHIKFDISDGQIGFVLPTVVPPCDVSLFSKLGSGDKDPTDETCWKTCIVLPFRSKKDEAFPVEKFISMFSSFHPSMLLFLHRLKCIKFRNIPNDSLIVMRKQVDKDGIVNVFLGKEKFTWFVKSLTLQADHICHDVQTTEISVALVLEDLGNGNYISKLDQQPVFALFPSGSYGLKFLIQADFFVSSSRNEVDGHSPWNQWLLLEFPNLLVNAELSFCSLPCFKKNPAKGVSVFMSFIPLEGEVHGFFSQLPRMIISKLCSSNCLLLQGEDNEWVAPCKVLRNWTEKTRSLLPDRLIREHLDVGYLHKDTLLTDSLARALGIEECGPKVLIQVMASLCRADSLTSMGLDWLSSWLNVLFLMLVNATESDFISSIRQLPIIPLLDGNYASINEGAIWLHTDREHGLEAFGKLYSKLRIVNPALFSDHVENITQMLYKVGVQRLSAHEVLKRHVLPAICDEKVMAESTELMIEYLSFIKFHLESSCSECHEEKEDILSQLRNNAFVSTNHGYKRLADVPIHFSKQFGNLTDMSKLVRGSDMQWFEIDISYLKHQVCKSSPQGTSKWRSFLQDLGVTDFVKIVKVEKLISDIPHTVLTNMMLDDDCVSSGSIVIDYDSQELTQLLSHVSSNGNKEKGKYLLRVLDGLWDDYFSDKITGLCEIDGQFRPFKSSLIKILHSFRWLASSMDDQLRFSKDGYHNCETVRSILGHRAPYSVPKVKSVKFLNDIGLKQIVTLDDALSILDVWRGSKKPFRASISQMSKFYAYLWSEMSISKRKIVETLHSQAFIFVPSSVGSTSEVLSGLLLSPSEVYWQDSIISSVEQTKSTKPQLYECMTHRVFSKMLCNVYPDLRHFFVREFGVAENPPLLCYLQFLLQLSTENLPSLAAKTVFQVFKKWSDGLDSEVLSSDDIDYLKKSMKEKETRILPTEQDKWVSLHESFGHICWCDDEQLKKDFLDLSNVEFLYLGELTNEEKQMLQDKVSVLFRRLGIPCLSEVVTREVIHYGPTDSSYMISLVRWALPYAQRYIYRMHPNEYSQLKLSGFKNVNSLKIVAVEKLCQKYVIKSFGIESKERECCCLLQDNTLYATRNADSHSLFMELSHFLLVGLPLANFLHLITTMTKSGFTEEKMELFVTDSQELPNLPCEELQWSLVSTSSPEVEPATTKKFAKNLSWPPVHWKTTPGFDETKLDAAEGLVESNGDWIIDENPDSSMPFVILEDDEALNGQSDSVINKGKNIVSVPPRHVRTGREGEREAFRYFSSTLSGKKVKWVNEVNESGLPYDILVEGKDKSEEYIEVKSTSVAKKDWFYLSMNEWKFAEKKGECFSIARVVLSDGKPPVITIYRNPAKLCQKRKLQVALHPLK